MEKKEEVKSMLAMVSRMPKGLAIFLAFVIGGGMSQLAESLPVIGAYLGGGGLSKVLEQQDFFKDEIAEIRTAQNALPGKIEIKLRDMLEDVMVSVNANKEGVAVLMDRSNRRDSGVAGPPQ